MSNGEPFFQPVAKSQFWSIEQEKLVDEQITREEFYKRNDYLLPAGEKVKALQKHIRGRYYGTTEK